jgi:hypothetical protein
MYQGEERDGGLIYRNLKPTSARSPHWRGKVYIVGVGWYWFSGWTQGPDDNPYIRASLQEMTDEQALKFCKPKPANATPRSIPTPQPKRRNGADSDNDIPF